MDTAVPTVMAATFQAGKSRAATPTPQILQRESKTDIPLEACTTRSLLACVLQYHKPLSDISSRFESPASRRAQYHPGQQGGQLELRTHIETRTTDWLRQGWYLSLRSQRQPRRRCDVWLPYLASTCPHHWQPTHSIWQILANVASSWNEPGLTWTRTRTTVAVI